MSEIDAWNHLHDAAVNYAKERDANKVGEPLLLITMAAMELAEAAIGYAKVPDGPME